MRKRSQKLHPALLELSKWSKCKFGLSKKIRPTKTKAKRGKSPCKPKGNPPKYPNKPKQKSIKKQRTDAGGFLAESASHKISPFKLHLTQPKKKPNKIRERKKQTEEKWLRGKRSIFCFCPFCWPLFCTLPRKLHYHEVMSDKCANVNLWEPDRKQSSSLSKIYVCFCGYIRNAFFQGRWLSCLRRCSTISDAHFFP